ncbi:uncharacterized protein LOC131189654 [Ahaetulla prasina]|uniref:uncharacterized protein LOC131189654 n=1 Tax=Ahaetulla prasina TaxID=499056 RepID=UPI0026498A3C|nr:uncharacterized protein LOC131189654 [Ahaetulla prasina]
MEIELVKTVYSFLVIIRGSLTPNPAHFPRGPPKDTLTSQSGRQRSTACYRCGKEGHRADDCRVKLVPKTTPIGGKEPVKPAAKARKPAKVGEGVTKKATPIREEHGTPTESDDSKTTSESDEDLLLTQTRGERGTYLSPMKSSDSNRFLLKTAGTTLPIIQGRTAQRRSWEELTVPPTSSTHSQKMNCAGQKELGDALSTCVTTWRNNMLILCKYGYNAFWEGRSVMYFKL